MASGAETQAVLDELGKRDPNDSTKRTQRYASGQLPTHRLFGRRSEKDVPVIEQGVLPLEPAAAGLVQPENHRRITARRNLRRCVAGGATPVGVDCQLICHASVSR